MPRAHPEEFRQDVVASARRHEMPMSQITKDFGISESCLIRWVRQAEIDDGVKLGVSSTEQAELREARKRIKNLEQENYILRRAAAYLSQHTSPKGLTRWSASWPPRESP